MVKDNPKHPHPAYVAVPIAPPMSLCHPPINIPTVTTYYMPWEQAEIWCPELTYWILQKDIEGVLDE